MHRKFMPVLLRLETPQAQGLLLQLIETLTFYLGELLKQLHISPVPKDIYRGAVKILIVLGHSAEPCSTPQHDPDRRTIDFRKDADPLQAGLKIDHVEDIRVPPPVGNDSETLLKQTGLLELIDQALMGGPSEDAAAYIAHAIQRSNGKSAVGYLPIHANLMLIDAVVLHITVLANEKGIQQGGPLFIQGSTDSALITMLVHELTSEARYYFINSMADHLRYPNAHTLYFSQAILDVFSNELDDQEESDIQQQIARILLERLIGPWPQPWGLLVTTYELIKNEKFMFVELSFSKAHPKVVKIMRSLTAPVSPR